MLLDLGKVGLDCALTLLIGQGGCKRGPLARASCIKFSFVKFWPKLHHSLCWEATRFYKQLIQGQPTVFGNIYLPSFLAKDKASMIPSTSEDPVDMKESGQSATIPSRLPSNSILLVGRSHLRFSHSELTQDYVLQVRMLWFFEPSQELRMLSPSLCIQRSQCNYSYCCFQFSEM